MNTAENEIVPLQHNSLNSIDTSHFYSLRQVKLQFPLQNEVVPLTSKHLQNFPGEKSLSNPYSPIFKLQLQSPFVFP